MNRAEQPADKAAEKTGWFAELAKLANRSAAASGVLVTFVLFAAIVVPALVLERRKAPPPPSDQPAAPSAGWLDPADAPPSRGKELPPVDPDTVLKPNPKLLARGKALYEQHCSSCHGTAGRGDGPAATTLNPKPRDFTTPNGWKLGYHLTEVFRTVSNGIKGTGMTAFDFLTPSDRMAVVHHVRALGSFDHGTEKATAIEALAEQFRSQAVRIPNRIPVGLAVRRMVGEQRPVPPIPAPAADDTSTRAQVLRRVIAEPGRDRAHGGGDRAAPRHGGGGARVVGGRTGERLLSRARHARARGMARASGRAARQRRLAPSIFTRGDQTMIRLKAWTALLAVVTLAPPAAAETAAPAPAEEPPLDVGVD